jgi:hypothetical protein
VIDLGRCIIELFSRPPRAQAGFDCVSKHLAEHAQMRNQARRNHAPAPPRPRLWMISPGRPRSLIAGMGMKPMEDWPTGFWHMDGEFHVHLIAVRDLPVTPDTLLLRLLDNGKRLQRAMAELDALPRGSRLWQTLAQLILAWRREMFEASRQEHSREDHMMSPESQARYDAWEREVRGEGIKEGRKQGRKAGRKAGIQAGIEKGERALVRKQLTLRFGELPADAEQRLKQASLAELELWAERVLTAGSLAAVLAPAGETSPGTRRE